jgi:hypothetical protein
MCAEAVCWRCHRGIITDYLIAADEAQSHRRRTLDYRSGARIGWIAELSDRRKGSCCCNEVAGLRLSDWSRVEKVWPIPDIMGILRNAQADAVFSLKQQEVVRMFSVIFEVLPKKERFDEYLELAKYLQPTGAASA